MSDTASSRSASAASPSTQARRTVAVFEPNSGLLRYLGREMSARFSPRLYADGVELLQALQAGPPPDLILFAWESAASSLAALTDALAAVPRTPMILLLQKSDAHEIDQVLRLGVTSVMLKPYDYHDLEAVIAKTLAQGEESPQLHPAVEVAPREVAIGEGRFFVSASRAMRAIEIQGSLVAASDIPVLILGESGTGKEVIAMYVHRMSHRAGKTFLKVNCAAMPADLLESELFGYEQGAFTGAARMKPGKFEICSGGTIFLDEIGEMPAILQAKLLHVLQDGTFSRLGGRVTLKADVRVIAATNVNIREAIEKKTFREDLYYRLNGFTLSLPPLRDRQDEVALLAGYFMRRSAEKYARQPLAFSPRLLQAFSQYQWPGNLRELENIVNRFLILQDEQAILADLLGKETTVEEAISGVTAEPGLKQVVRDLKGNAEALAIANALKETGWNRKMAANQLKISYKALLYKIKDYNLSPR